MNQSLANRLRWPLLCLGLLAVLAGMAGWLLLPADPIDQKAFDRIQLGMTEEGVEAAIGIPPEDDHSDLLTLFACRLLSNVASKGAPLGDQDATKFWCGDEFWIAVKFNDAGTAIGISLWEAPSMERPGFMDLLRTRLGL